MGTQMDSTLYSILFRPPSYTVRVPHIVILPPHLVDGACFRPSIKELISSAHDCHEFRVIYSKAIASMGELRYLGAIKNLLN